jgi:hypothetical protein
MELISNETGRLNKWFNIYSVSDNENTGKIRIVSRLFKKNIY